MVSLERLRDIRNLNLLLFDGLTESEFYKNREHIPRELQETGESTGYAEFDLITGKITTFDAYGK